MLMKCQKKLLFIFFSSLLYTSQTNTMSTLSVIEKLIMGGKGLNAVGQFGTIIFPFLTKQDVGIKNALFYVFQHIIPLHTLASVIKTKKENKPLSLCQKLELGWVAIIDLAVLYKIIELIKFIKSEKSLLDQHAQGQFVVFGIIGVSRFLLSLVTLGYVYNLCENKIKFYEHIKKFIQKFKGNSAEKNNTIQRNKT